MEMLLDILLDAVFDTLYLIPFLLVTYIAMEWLEHGASRKFQEAIEEGGAVGPAIGAVLGVVPQCGFSAAASTFYAARVITLGTLIAVFLSLRNHRGYSWGEDPYRHLLLLRYRCRFAYHASCA